MLAGFRSVMHYQGGNPENVNMLSAFSKLRSHSKDWVTGNPLRTLASSIIVAADVAEPGASTSTHWPYHFFKHQSWLRKCFESLKVWGLSEQREEQRRGWWDMPSCCPWSPVIDMDISLHFVFIQGNPETVLHSPLNRRFPQIQNQQLGKVRPSLSFIF